IFILISLPHIYSLYFFFFNPTPPTEIYTLSLHDALPISSNGGADEARRQDRGDHRRWIRHRAGRLHPVRPRGRHGRRCRIHLRRSEEHTSELQSRFDLVCRLLLEKKNIKIQRTNSSN